MKRFLYTLCLVALLTGLSSCSKNNDPAPTSPIVGRWELNRGLLSGFPSTTNYNGNSVDLYLFESIGSTIDIFSDNTFNENLRKGGVGDAGGTWEFNNNSLTLKYDSGDQDTYTYSKNKNIEELTSTTSINYSLPASTTATSTTATVAGKIQFVYRK